MAINSYRDLAVWEKAHQLVLDIYEDTKRFPKEEMYGLTSQVRRAAVSVPANVAEGFKRISKKEKLRFYNISQSSLEEVRYYLLLAQDLGYSEKGSQLEALASEVSKLLHSMVQSVLKRLNHENG